MCPSYQSKQQTTKYNKYVANVKKNLKILIPKKILLTWQ